MLLYQPVMPLYQPVTDAALPTRDAALPTRDAALPTRDAALPTRDAALPTRDAALPTRYWCCFTNQAQLMKHTVVVVTDTQAYYYVDNSLDLRCLPLLACI